MTVRRAGTTFLAGYCSPAGYREHGAYYSLAGQFALLLLLLFLPGALASRVIAQEESPALTYYSAPGEDFDDVISKLDTSAAVVRRLNQDKIGPGGKLKPHTPLRIPTTPARSGMVLGTPPPKSPPAARPSATPPPERVRAPDTALPPKTTPAPPGATTYDTRPTPTAYDTRTAGPFWVGALRLVIALAVVLGVIWGSVRLIRRFGWDGPLARWGNAVARRPAEEPSGVAARAPTPAGKTQGAPEPPNFDALLREAARSSARPAAPPVEKRTPDPLWEPAPKADTNTRSTAFDANPDDDQIPQTSLEDALRRRRAG